MKNLFFIIILLSISSHAQDITGKWFGTLNVQGQSLTIVFKIEQIETQLISTMDSPGQGGFDIPTTSTIYADDVLTILASAMKMKYEAQLSEDGQFLEGTFIQGSMALPLKMSREKVEKEKIMRPQDPKEFPYERKDVRFYNAGDDLYLTGTLTYPTNKEFDKVVILISGSGPQNRDEEIAAFNHRPFLVLSDYFTRNRIAVLRYDDRGVSESGGKFIGSTSEDFAQDVEAAIHFIKSSNELQDKQLGLVGHSEGGMIAPMVASKNDEVDFIVLMSGPGTAIKDLMLKQADLIGAAGGTSKDVLEANHTIMSKLYDYIIDAGHNDKNILQKGIIHILKENLNIFPEKTLAEIKQNETAFFESHVSSLLDDWFLYFIKFNPSEYLSKVQCPVLAINGALDLQVPADDNLLAIQEAITKGGNNKLTTKKFENQNHLFQTAKTGAPSEYSQIEETFSEITMQYIAEWINKTMKQ